MNWTKGGKLSAEEVDNLEEDDVVFVNVENHGVSVPYIGDVATLELASIDLTNWDVYNVSVEDVSPDAEYRAGRERMRENGWTDELFEQYFPNHFDHRLLPDIQPGTTPEDEQANRDWGMFS